MAQKLAKRWFFEIPWILLQWKFVSFAVFCTNPLFGKDLVPEIKTKMLSVIQIAGFLKQRFLQNKSMKQPHFLHFDINSQKLKLIETFLVRLGQKWVWPIYPLDWNWLYLKNELMELNDFLHTGMISHTLKSDWKFWGWAWSELGMASLVTGL